MKKETWLNDWFLNLPIEIMEKICGLKRDYVLESAFDFTIRAFNWWKNQPIYTKSRIYDLNKIEQK